jgi:hypothetical protein
VSYRARHGERGLGLRIRLAADLVRKVLASGTAVQLWTAARRIHATSRDYDGLPASATPEERFAQLRAERLVVASPAARSVKPRGVPQRPGCSTRSVHHEAQRNCGPAAHERADAHGADGCGERAAAGIPIDRTGITIDDVEEPIIVFCRELASRAEAIGTEAQKRHTAAASLAEHAAAATPEAQASALTQAAKHLLGEDFKLLPEFDLPAERAAELQNALAPAAATGLLDFLVNTREIPLPVDEWLQGLARVRDKMHAFEQVQTFVDAFGRPAPQLQAAQLPFKSGDHWLGLEFPED